MVMSAFKTPLETFAYPPKFIFEPSLENLEAVFTDYDLLEYLRNSMIVAVGTTAVAMVLAVPAAYGIERLQLRRREGIAYTFLAMQMVPAIAVVFALFGIGSTLGLI